MNKSFYISDAVQNNVIFLYGDTGRNWLQNLPQFISTYENQWKFKAGECFSDAQFNVVLNAFKNDKTEVVFKCCVPNKEFQTEVKALAHYNGDGAVKLLKNDTENGAILLEKIKPGATLEKNNSIEDATQQAILVCKKLHKPIQETSQFPTLQNWFDGLNRASADAIDKQFIEKAKQLSRELLSSQTKLVLLHGDLHYANLLSSSVGYTAIDPKGIVGEAEFEIPLPRVQNIVDQKELLSRVDCFIEQSHFDKKRIYAWLFSKAVLAACWTIEDSRAPNEQTVQFLSVAESLKNV